LLSTENWQLNFYAGPALKISPRKGDAMLTSFILALIKLLSNPVLVAALAKFLANALKTVS
jgi:hypothetical protein